VLHEIPLERQHAMTSKDVVDAATKPKDGGPGLDVGGQERPCAPDDSSPAGTIVGGYRKVVSQSPFSKICRWVPVNR
jgi:hypothetical protein